MGQLKAVFRVLAVDDDWVIRRQLKRMKIWGVPSGFIIADEASDGSDAMQKLAAEPFDLVLTDIRMPKMDGIELLMAIIEQKLAPCVVFLSEHTEFRYAKQGLIHGAFDYLVKPIVEEDLVHLLHRTGQYLKSLRITEDRARVSEAMILLPVNEIGILKEYIRAVDSKSIEMAGVVAEKLLTAFSQDVNRAETVLENILQEARDTLREQAIWIEKFVDLRQITLHETGRLREPKQLIAAFTNVVRKIMDLANKFKCIERHGPLVRQVSRYVLENIGKEFSARDISVSLFINRCYISQAFKDKTGMTLGNYITGLKMERAKKLLNQGGIEVREIASELGYKDAEYFSRQFKKHTTYSPTAYRDLAACIDPITLSKDFQG